MKARKLMDFLSMISLPPKDAKSVLFDPTAPTFYPDGSIDSIAKNTAVVARVQMRGQDISGITEPTKIPLQPLKIMGFMDMFNDEDMVTLTYDGDSKEIVLSGISNNIEKTANMSTIVLDDVTTSLDAYPVKLDENGNPLFKNGQIKPNISATIDAAIFKDQINYAEKVKAEPKIYYIEIDGGSGTITTKVGDPQSRAKDKISAIAKGVEVVGVGAVSYALGFEEVMRNLTGPIDILTISGGPMFVSQKTEDYKVSYLISPTVLKAGGN